MPSILTPEFLSVNKIFVALLLKCRLPAPNIYIYRLKNRNKIKDACHRKRCETRCFAHTLMLRPCIFNADKVQNISSNTTTLMQIRHISSRYLCRFCISSSTQPRLCKSVIFPPAIYATSAYLAPHNHAYANPSYFPRLFMPLLHI